MKATNKKNVKETNTVKSTTKVETSKTTTAKKTSKVQSMIATLQSMVDKITDKKLKAEVQNSLKVKNPKESDLAALIKRVIDTGKQPVVANEVKPPVKKTVTKKTEEKSTEKKPVTKKKVEESPVTTVQTTGNLKPATAMYFPETIVEELNDSKVTLKRVADDEFTSIKSIIDFIESGNQVYFACFWSPRHIKEFNYKLLYNVKEAPKKFPNDLDIVVGITVSEKNGKLYAMSSYTEAMYVFFEDEFSPVEDTNPYNGEKYTVRVSNGMEFAVYVEAKEPPKTKKTVKKTK